MANESVKTNDSVSMKLIGPDGVLKAESTGIVSDMETRRRALLALVSKLLKENKHV